MPKSRPTRCACVNPTHSPSDDPAVYRRQSQILKAMANPARLQMIHHLAGGEHSVGVLTAIVGLDQSTVSKHLTVLRHHGIVADRREGNMVYYRLLTPCVLEFFGCADRVLGTHGARP